jgi:tetratricopeptide (TPR) repeat protein
MTKEIARSFGARVLSVPWEDDFSKARNAALRASRCDWVLVLDADELLDSGANQTIPPLLTAAAIAGYDVRIWNYVNTLTTRMLNRPANPNPHRIEEARAFPSFVEHANVRLFRRHPQIFFEGRVHEGVADGMRASGMKIASADFVVHHLGLAEDQTEVRDRKMTYYLDLGRKKLLDSPHDVRSHYELGLAELEHSRSPGRALPYFLRATELRPDSNLLWTYVGICLVRLGKLKEGLEALEKSERLGATDAVHLEAMGDAHYHMKNFPHARRNYERAKSAGCRSNLLESKLGVCEVRMGSPEGGLKRIKDAIQSEPNLGELYDILMAAALFAGDRALAAQTAECRLKVGSPSPDSILFTAAIWMQLGEWQQAAQVVRSGCERFPGDAKLHATLAEINHKLDQNRPN